MANSFSDNWIRCHPGKTMSIYDILLIVKEALPLAVTPRNITVGLECTGIFPFNRDIFTDLNFLPSAVTDRPAPEASENNTGKITPKMEILVPNRQSQSNVTTQQLNLRLRECRYQSLLSVLQDLQLMQPFHLKQFIRSQKQAQDSIQEKEIREGNLPF